MKSRWTTQVVSALVGVLLAGITAPDLHGQGRVEGQVFNGTFNRPVANQEVRLLSPQGGMQQVAAALTNTDGRYVFATEEINLRAFYLLETRYQGISYPAPVRFDSGGTATVNLTVYEATPAAPPLVLELVRVFVRAEGGKVLVQEEYSVRNPSQPPRAYADEKGTFRFRIPPGATGPTASVLGLLDMPLSQAVQPGKSAGDFSITYPLKPGLTRVVVAYEADYAASAFTLSERLAYPADRAEAYVSPSSLSVASPIFQPMGVDPTHDIEKLEARTLPREALLELRLSGESAAPATPEGGQGGPEIQILPNSITRQGVLFLALFLLFLLWALGVRVAKEWPRWQAARGVAPEQKELAAKVETMLNSLADLDELFAAKKIPEAKYWKARLDLKAKLVTALKKTSPSVLESYAARQSAP